MEGDSSAASMLPSLGIHQQHFNQDFRHRKVNFGRWVLLPLFTENGFDFQEMFDYLGSSDFGLKCDPYLIKQSFANFASIVNVDATSLVKGKDLDFSVLSLNVVAHSSNSGVKFLESYTKTGMFDVQPIEILWAILDDPSMTEVEKPEANDFNIHRRLLHHIVYNIILG